MASFLSTDFFFFSRLPFTLISRQGLAFSSVTGSCEGNSLVSLRPARASRGVRLEKACLPSKDCPLEVVAGAATRSACCWLHVPRLSALFCVTVRSGGEGLAEVWKHQSSDKALVSHRLESDHSERKGHRPFLIPGNWLGQNSTRQIQPQLVPTLITVVWKRDNWLSCILKCRAKMCRVVWKWGEMAKEQERQILTELD